MCIWGVWLHTRQGFPSSPPSPAPAKRPLLPSEPGAVRPQCALKPHLPAPQLSRPPSAASTGSRNRRNARRPMDREGTGGRGPRAVCSASRLEPPSPEEALAGRKGRRRRQALFPLPLLIGEDWVGEGLGRAGAVGPWGVGDAQVGAEAAGTSLRLATVPLPLLGGEEWPGGQAPPAMKQQAPS